MKFARQLKSFVLEEHGAVTVDWTVVGAAVVGLGLASVGAVRTGVVDLGIDIDSSLSGASVTQLGTLGGNGWEYPGLFSTKEWLDGPYGYIAQITRWGYSASQLQSIYTAYANAAQRYLDQGNTRYAGLYADHMYAVDQILQSMGSTLPAGSIGVQDMTIRILAA